MIESSLPWKVGRGWKIRIGEDPWAGCNQHHSLLAPTVDELIQRAIIYLAQLASPTQLNRRTQSWIRVGELNLLEQAERELELYIAHLYQLQTHLRDREDVLIWDSDPAGRYTPKAGYIKSSTDGVQGELTWWWKALWKIKSAPKTRVFMWCALQNKVPTWDNLQKRCFQGPGWCALCQVEDETMLHIFVNCSYIKEVWRECQKVLGRACNWVGISVLQAWES